MTIYQVAQGQFMCLGSFPENSTFLVEVVGSELNINWHENFKKSQNVYSTDYTNNYLPLQMIQNEAEMYQFLSKQCKFKNNNNSLL